MNSLSSIDPNELVFRSPAGTIHRPKKIFSSRQINNHILEATQLIAMKAVANPTATIYLISVKEAGEKAALQLELDLCRGFPSLSGRIRPTFVHPGGDHRGSRRIIKRCPIFDEIKSHDIVIVIEAIVDSGGTIGFLLGNNPTLEHFVPQHSLFYCLTQQKGGPAIPVSNMLMEPLTAQPYQFDGESKPWKLYLLGYGLDYPTDETREFKEIWGVIPGSTLVAPAWAASFAESKTLILN